MQSALAVILCIGILEIDLDIQAGRIVHVEEKAQAIPELRLPFALVKLSEQPAAIRGILLVSGEQVKQRPEELPLVPANRAHGNPPGNLLLCFTRTSGRALQGFRLHGNLILFHGQ